MKKLLLLFCLPMIFSCGSDEKKNIDVNSSYKVLAKYNGIDLLMGEHYEMSLLLCNYCNSDNPNDDNWKKTSNWTKRKSKVLRLSYFAEINYDEDDMQYYTVSKEVEKLKIGDIYWIELEFPRIDMNDIFLGAYILEYEADFISAQKATDNEITEYFFEEPISEENYSD